MSFLFGRYVYAGQYCALCDSLAYDVKGGAAVLRLDITCTVWKRYLAVLTPIELTCARL